MTTLDMVVTANTKTRPSKMRLLKYLNSLGLSKIRVARTTHCCQLCACPINGGEEFRDGGPGRNAHEFCYQAVRKEFS